MKAVFEGMLFALFLLIGVFFSMGMYQTGVQITRAKEYHAWLTERLESTHYAKEEQERCIALAKEEGYTVSIREEEKQGKQVKVVTMEYQVSVPFQEEKLPKELERYSYIKWR